MSTGFFWPYAWAATAAMDVDEAGEGFALANHVLEGLSRDGETHAAWMGRAVAEWRGFRAAWFAGGV